MVRASIGVGIGPVRVSQAIKSPVSAGDVGRMVKGSFELGAAAAELTNAVWDKTLVGNQTKVAIFSVIWGVPTATLAGLGWASIAKAESTSEVVGGVFWGALLTLLAIGIFFAPAINAHNARKEREARMVASRSHNGIGSVLPPAQPTPLSCSRCDRDALTFLDPPLCPDHYAEHAVRKHVRESPRP